MARRKRKKKSGGFKVFLLIVIILAGACFGVYKNVLNYNTICDPTDTNYYEISVKSGMNGEAIAQLLENKGIISDALRFRLRAKLLKLDVLFQAGDYRLSPSMCTDDIYKALQNAKRETVDFTIPEGYYIRQVADKLVKDGLIASSEEFYKACEDDYSYDFLPDAKDCTKDPTSTLSARANRLEGYLYPNTYQVYKGASAHDIIDKMLSGFADIYTDELQNQAEKMGLSTQEMITIASLIEKETMVSSEREKVASVIYNRLKQPMRLQLDASIQYCLGEHKERVLYKDLEIDSPYNTYRHDGLPAGPIASPGLASIKAALFPADTNYLYYVLKPNGSGEHNFAETSAQFQNYNKQYKDSL